jgi:hypothetical protein
MDFIAFPFLEAAHLKAACRSRATHTPCTLLYYPPMRIDGAEELMMTDSQSKSAGQCRCGRVQFELSSEPLITMACHCRGCQRMTGSAFSLSTLYPSGGLTLTRGEPVIGGLHGATRHFFCPYCMSWLFTRPEGMHEFVNVRASMMDDDETYSPFIETCTDEKMRWATTPAVHSFGRFPSQNDFPHLLAEFAKQRNSGS